MRNLILFCCIFFTALMVSGQQSSITTRGVVLDAETGTPIPGVNVIEKGTTNGVVTDFDGKFALSLPKGATLQFSYIGFSSQEVVVELQYSYPYFKFNDWSTGELVEVLYDMYEQAPRKAADTPTNPDYDFEALPEQVLGVWESTYAWDRNLWPFNKKMTSVEASNNYDPKNMVIFRYADLLLLMADVENELGNTSVGLTYLNRVLTRARESGQGGEYPKNQTNLSQDELRDKIFYERMFELAGEPEMYEDVRRRGTEYLREVIEIHNQSKNVKFRYEFEAANGVGGQFRDYEIKNISEDFLRKNLLLPISADEITSNEELSLEDQNFGY